METVELKLLRGYERAGHSWATAPSWWLIVPSCDGVCVHVDTTGSNIGRPRGPLRADTVFTTDAAALLQAALIGATILCYRN